MCPLGGTRISLVQQEPVGSYGFEEKMLRQTNPEDCVHALHNEYRMNNGRRPCIDKFCQIFCQRVYQRFLLCHQIFACAHKMRVVL